MGNFDKSRLDDYTEVSDRIKEFRAVYPQGTLQAECQFMEINGRWAAIVKAFAYRTPDDERPGTGLAIEYIPGTTPYTKDSELQNAETAARGRALVAVGVSDTKASREEVRNRTDPGTYKDPIYYTNEAGRDALRKLCTEKGWHLKDAAAAFQKKYNEPPLTASNEELNEFVSLVRGGLISIDEPAPASA